MLLTADVSERLAWLHDCVLQELSYDVSNPQERTLILEVECPEDLGYSEWDGRALRLKATEVYLFRYTGWGHASGPEVMDACRPGVSPSTQVDLQRGRDAGLAVPALAFTVSFHSGSFFELVCKDISIEVVA